MNWIRLWRQSPWLWSWLVIGSCLTNAAAYAWLWLVKIGLDSLSRGASIRLPVSAGFGLLALGFARGFGRFLIKKTSFDAAQDVAQEPRLAIHTQIQQLSPVFLKSMGHAEILARLSTDTGSTRRFLSNEAVEGTAALVGIFLLVGILWFVNPQLAFMAMIRDADCICVLDQGHIIQQGAHHIF